MYSTYIIYNNHNILTSLGCEDGFRLDSARKGYFNGLKKPPFLFFFQSFILSYSHLLENCGKPNNIKILGSAGEGYFKLKI
jgi:hypothetical protein